jgi:dihydroorotate dehydrogenase (NAD+) catalytic subunit
MVYQVTKFLKIPVIGVGGIVSGSDAVEYFLAGATAVQVGTSNFQDPRAPVHILKQLRRFMETRGLNSMAALIGKMKS